ncbi:MAG TPA: hypothetical protein DIT07_13025 [Sphingobacteriaceae bacterium]|nr:hypothetical protein [Sphingobacteriaceae bacterium]
MKNAIKYGALIGILSGIWLLVMHFSGVFENVESGQTSWMEYASVLIPLTGLYLGIKNFRDHINGGKMEFFEGLFEGFVILITGGLITTFFAVIYIQNVSSLLQTDYMGRIGGAGVVGILLDIAISLSLMNKQKHL